MPGPTRGKARRVVHAPSHVRPQAQLEVWGVPARVKLVRTHDWADPNCPTAHTAPCKTSGAPRPQDNALEQGSVRIQRE